MSLQLSDVVRNARLNAIEAAIGLAPVLTIRTGGRPPTCAAPDSGTLLATMTLPADWLQTASSGQIGKAGLWAVPHAEATGLAAHFRLKDASGLCHIQGSVSKAGGGGDLIVDHENIAAGQAVTVNGFTLLDNNG